MMMWYDDMICLTLVRKGLLWWQRVVVVVVVVVVGGGGVVHTLLNLPIF